MRKRTVGNMRRLCINCNKPLVRKTWNSRLEQTRDWEKRKFCNPDCLNAKRNKDAMSRLQFDLIAEDTRKCVTCNKPLERNTYNSRLETMGQWRTRTHCSDACLKADPVEIARRLEISLLGAAAKSAQIIANRPAMLLHMETIRILSNAPSEKRKQSARDRWARGETRAPHHIKRSRDQGITYNGLTDDEIFAIQLDRRPMKEIAKAFSVGPSTIGRVKKRYDSYIGSNFMPVETPLGRFKSVTLAAKHFKIDRHTAAKLAKAKKNGWRYA